jgi:hypothetical protein
MLTRRFLLALLTTASLSGAACAQTAPQPAAPVRAVLELFTSQGCSSCPPADKLFVKLAREPGVVALSMPVTIWDYLGWRDTLAQQTFTARQRHYGVVRGDRHIYTPQAVVNGAAHAVGSDFHAIEAARRTSAGMAGVLSVPVSLKRADGAWSVEIGAGAGTGIVMLAVFDRRRQVEIDRGENTGRKITYGNVVRELSRVGEFSGEARTISLPQTLANNAEQGFVVLVQAGTERRPGVILGAAESPRDFLSQ